MLCESITKILITAGELSRFKIDVQVFDLEGNAVVPIMLRWTLSDIDGEIINNRLRESVSNPALINPIILYGQDLSITETSSAVTRILLIESEYTEGIIVGMPYTHEYHFVIKNYVALPIIAGSTGMPAVTDGGVDAITDGGVPTIID